MTFAMTVTLKVLMQKVSGGDKENECMTAKFGMAFPAGFFSSAEYALLLMSPQPDRTYDLKIGQPTVSYFLKQAAGITKGAGKTGEACCCEGVLVPLQVLPSELSL